MAPLDMANCFSMHFRGIMDKWSQPYRIKMKKEITYERSKE